MARAVDEWPAIKAPTELLIPFRPSKFEARIFYCVDYGATGDEDVGVGAFCAAHLKVGLEAAGFSVDMVKDPLHDHML